tara:strand:+ start:966 stop:1397 length:432 start_codon:yes stop_codon:yes gene_type:complete
MAKYRQAKTLEVEVAAYIAGLVDGEGSITLTRKHKGDMRQPAITIASTEKQLLVFALDQTGVGKITNKKTNANYKDAFTYAVYNRHALDVLRQIEPYMLSYKKARARLLLDKYVQVTPRNGKYSEALLIKRAEFEQNFIDIVQ